MRLWTDSAPMRRLALACSRTRSSSSWVGPWSARSLHHRPHGVQGRRLLLLVQGGVDAQKAGVRVVGHIGVDGVAEAPLLPHLLEEPGGAAAAQQGVEQQQLLPPGVQIGEGREGQQIRWFCSMAFFRAVTAGR